MKFITASPSVSPVKNALLGLISERLFTGTRAFLFGVVSVLVSAASWVNAAVITVDTSNAANWKKSTFSYVDNTDPNWPGVTTPLPSAASYTVATTFNPTLPAGFGGIFATSGVTFYRSVFSLPSFSTLTADLSARVDNNIQIFVNGVSVAGFGTDTCGFCGPDFRLFIGTGGAVTNGYSGGRAFSTVQAPYPPITWISGGINEIVVAVRNLDAPVFPNDTGGFRLSLVLNTTDAPGVTFSQPVPDVFPGTEFLTCIIGNFQEPTRIQNWKLRWQGSGTVPAILTVAATTVNTSESGAIEATVTGPGLPPQIVTVNHPASQGDNLGMLSLSLQPGTTYDLAIRRTGQAAHYKLGAPDKQLEIGFAHPLLYLEHHQQAWVVNAAPNETVNIDVLTDNPPIGGAGPQATTLTYSVRRLNCSVVVRSTTIQGAFLGTVQQPVQGAISFNAGSDGSFVIYFESMNGHFAVRKTSGVDGGFYALPCPPKVRVNCPPNIVRPQDPRQCGAKVSFDATVSGVCDTLVTYSHQPGSFFPIGTTVVTASATDIFGETAMCSFTVTVKDTVAPVGECVPTTNPAGKTIPAAGNNPKSGQNPDGFYQLIGRDNCDDSSILALFVYDTGSSYVAGPFKSGDKVKITQAPGVTPNTKPMAGDIVAHIQLKGDAYLIVTDATGNISSREFCRVAPPPK
ncbi:MAG: HYR domain-containing protein [Verrucomicrobia bacterium]|nr:HYR domain-containing protein [Verrucomicrobiota bacterium]